MTLRAARILSSENDASVKTSQNQTTNVNIKVQPDSQKKGVTGQSEQDYPNLRAANMNIAQGVDPSAFPSVQPKVRCPSVPPYGVPQYDQQPEMVEREVLTQDIEDLEKQKEFLELLVSVYECNPLRVNNYLVCKSRTLMDMIKLLTDADKVDLVLDDNLVYTSCCTNTKYTYIAKILVTKNNKTEDLKYAYNDVHSKFIKHGISLKIIV